MLSLLPILAENYGPLLALILGAPLVLLAVAGVSFIPSARGQRLGVILAAPVVGLGLLLFVVAATGKAPCAILVLSLLPAAAGFGSIMLWAQKRGGK